MKMSTSLGAGRQSQRKGRQPKNLFDEVKGECRVELKQGSKNDCKLKQSIRCFRHFSLQRRRARASERADTLIQAQVEHIEFMCWKRKIFMLLIHFTSIIIFHLLYGATRIAQPTGNTRSN